MNKILLVDDDQSILKSLNRLLKALDVELFSTESPIEAISMCEEIKFSLVISDQRMPDMEGTQLLAKLKQTQPDCTRIILSAFSDFDAITEAFNKNVINKFISKPWDNEELLNTVQHTLNERDHVIENSLGHEELISFHGIFSQSDNMLLLFEQIKRVATANVPVNIYGETGCGKELVANALHKEGTRADAPFVAINCANLTSELADSQLFGHKKGAFTGANSDNEGLLKSAHKGTIFLDEVTCLPIAVQTKLLRALQEKEFYRVGETSPTPFDVNIISASSISLKEATEKGDFRADLRYRLEVLPLKVPPLRERKTDIISLFNLFLKANRDNVELIVTPEVQNALFHYDWPGNVRELQNASLYAHAMNQGNIFDLPSLPEDILNNKIETPIYEQNNPVQNITRQSIQAALTKYQNNRTKAAQSLGVSRMTLWRHMKQLKLT